MDRADGSLLMLAFLLIAFSVLSLRAVTQDYDIHTPYPGGVVTAAKILEIKEYKQGRGVRRVIDVGYTDQNKREQQARLEGNGEHWLRAGNAIEISYVPGSYSTARWPAGRISDSEYNSWLRGLKIALFVGILCVLAIPCRRLFRRDEDSGLSSLKANSRYVLKLSFIRLLVNVAIFTAFFGLMYVCAYLYLFYLTGLALITSQILMAAISGLFLLALWNVIRPAIGHHPLVLTRRGFSIYHHGVVPWREVSEIEIFRGFRSSHVLRFYLADESEAEPRQRSFGKAHNPPRVVLNLECINWDEYELREELIKFALEGRDDDAIVAFRLSSINAGQERSGPINWPENMKDEIRYATEDDAETSGKPERSTSSYMSTGFYMGNR